MSKQTFAQMERTPDNGYSINRITIDTTAEVPVIPAQDQLTMLNTQELNALATELDADTQAQQAYWNHFKRHGDAV